MIKISQSYYNDVILGSDQSAKELHSYLYTFNRDLGLVFLSSRTSNRACQITFEILQSWKQFLVITSGVKVGGGEDKSLLCAQRLGQVATWVVARWIQFSSITKMSAFLQLLPSRYLWSCRIFNQHLIKTTKLNEILTNRNA